MKKIEVELGTKYVIELRNRINQISSIDDNNLFYVELGKIVDWLYLIPVFSSGFEYLEQQGLVTSLKRNRMRKFLFSQLIDVWKDINSLINTEKLDYIHSAEIYKNYDPITIIADLIALNKFENVDNLYQEIRLICEVLSYNEAYKKQIEKYLYFHINGHEPEFSGGYAYNDWIKLNQEEDLFKKELDNSNWGSWDHVKYISYLITLHDWRWQIKEWSLIYKKEEYLYYLHRVGNHLFDYINGIIKNPSTLTVSDANVFETPIMNVAAGKIEFQNMGALIFNPKTNPNSGADNLKATSETEDLANAIAKSKAGGLTFQNAKKIITDPSPLVADINSRLRKQAIGIKEESLVNIIRAGNGMRSRLFFKVVPLENIISKNSST